MAMELAKLAELKAILNDPTVQDIERIKEQHEIIKGDAVTLLKLIEAVYDDNDKAPVVWKEWCDKNMNDMEKEYVIRTYRQIKEMVANSI